MGSGKLRYSMTSNNPVRQVNHVLTVATSPQIYHSNSIQTLLISHLHWSLNQETELRSGSIRPMIRYFNWSLPLDGQLIGV